MSDPSAYFINSGSIITFSPASVQLSQGRTNAALRTLAKTVPAKTAITRPPVTDPPDATAFGLSIYGIYAQRRVAAEEANRV